MTGRRAKRSDICDSWVLVIHIWRTVDLVTSKVILGSFGAFAIFHDWGVMVRDRRRYINIFCVAIRVKRCEIDM